MEMLLPPSGACAASACFSTEAMSTAVPSFEVAASTGDLIPVSFQEPPSVTRRGHNLLKEAIGPDNLANLAGSDLLLDFRDLLVNGLNGGLNVSDR